MTGIRFYPHCKMVIRIFKLIIPRYLSDEMKPKKKNTNAREERASKYILVITIQQGMYIGKRVIVKSIHEYRSVGRWSSWNAASFQT